MTASPLVNHQPRRTETSPRTSPETARFRRRELILYDLELSKGAKVLYLALDEYARERGTCWPSQKTLCDRMDISRATFARWLGELKQRGFVRSARRDFKHGPNSYELVSSPDDLVSKSVHHVSEVRQDHVPKMRQDRHSILSEERKPFEQVKQPPVPPTETALVPALTQEQFTELEDGYDRHLKHHRLESRDIVLQMLMDQAQLGKFDWGKFRERHRQWCAAQERAGWRFCSLTFLAWIRAGYPPAAAQPSPIVDIQQRRREQGATLSGLFRNLDQGATR